MRSIILVLALTAVALLEHSFGAAIAGGNWPADLVFAIALLRLTFLSARGAAAWVFFAAAVSELFSRQEPGFAAAGVVLGLLSARLLFFSIFTHRTFTARVAGISLGTVIAFGSIALLRIVSLIPSGAITSSVIGDILTGAAVKMFWTAVGAMPGLLLIHLFANGRRAAARPRLSYGVP
jgi:hypothetical protein